MAHPEFDNVKWDNFPGLLQAVQMLLPQTDNIGKIGISFEESISHECRHYANYNQPSYADVTITLRVPIVNGIYGG